MLNIFKTTTTMKALLKKMTRNTAFGEKAQSPQVAVQIEKKKPSKTWMAAMEAAKAPVPFDRNAVDK